MATDNRTTPLLLLVLALGAGYLLYDGDILGNLGIEGVKQKKAVIAAKQDSLAKLSAQVDSAKAELARGSIEEVKRRLEGYRSSLGLLRRLVPERNEVPNLLDDISQRAKIRGVQLSQVTPLPLETGPAPFDTYRYSVAVVGHYDQIGQFLADVASLQRIIVPIDLSLTAAPQQAAKTAADTTGALLEAKFQIRTFVKATPDTEGGSGT